jgi:gamma-glutamylcyclotransferase (GGCT)/AIG2-like uncharacterized protein YtfP
MKNAFLFVYGTLLDDDNQYAVYLKNNSSFYADGRIRGELYDLGSYPGVVLCQAGDSFVYGSVLKIDRPQTVFAFIDRYEGYGAGQPVPNEFVRKLVDVDTDAGIVGCWIYLYNLSTDGSSLIRSGRYTK